MNLSWGNLDVRVYAAEAWVSLAPRFAADNPHIVDMLETMVVDPVPQVRLQVAHNLQVICKAAPERMWAIATRVATEEPYDGVLASFLNGFLRKFNWAETERCEAIIDIVRGRMRPRRPMHNAAATMSRPPWAGLLLSSGQVRGATPRADGSKIGRRIRSRTAGS
jgi:hypothetical protein